MVDLSIVDLGEWAEDSFSRLCSRAGVTRNKSTQDRTGWDYLIEFPAEVVSGVPADLQPPITSARVQVKSKADGKPYVSLKLSNALRFAKSSDTCFLVLYLATGGNEPVRIFARHFWRDEIEAALRRARNAHQEGRDDNLHKLTIRYGFTDADEYGDKLISWMESVVSGRTLYAHEKIALARNIGFEEGHIHGSVSFALEDLEALVDHQIGLRSTAPVVAVTINEKRFGIDSKKPIFSGTPDVAHLQSHPVPCRVRVRPVEGADVWLDGELRLPGLPGLPPEHMKLRVVADCLEIVMPARGEGSVTVNTDRDARRSLARLRGLTEILKGAAAGPLQIMVISEDRPNIRVEVELEDVENDDALSQLSNVIACMEKASAGILPAEFAVSLSEIDEAWNGIVDFNAMVGSTDFSANLGFAEPPHPKLATMKSIFFYDHIEIGVWVLGAVVRRSLEKIDIDGTRARLELGPARIVEGLVRQGTGSSILGELQALYRHAYEREKTSALELFGGSSRLLLQATGKAAAKPV